MKLLIMASIMISYLFSSASHPMMMIILIAMQTLLICVTLMLSLQTSWFSFILFLVFMGGLMVLFIYISSLASNESFSPNIWWKSPFNLAISSMILFIFMIILMNTQTINKIQLNAKEMIFKIYSPSIVWMTFMTMLYLLLVLVIIVNITHLKEGALRPFL